jgi:hypothetical protein
MHKRFAISAAFAAVASAPAAYAGFMTNFLKGASFPTVSFTAPAEGGTLSGNVQGPPHCIVQGSNIVRVEFYLNGVWTNTDGNLDNGLGCWIDTTTRANGTYTVKAIAYNAAGQISTATRSIVIYNEGGGTSQPVPASGIAAADIVDQAQAEVPFAQQRGYNTQVLAQYLPAPEIPETGLHAFTLGSGETLRFGKHVDPRNSTRKALAFQVDPRDVSTSGAKRSELKFPSNIDMDRIYWAAMSVYVYDWGTLSSADDGLFGLQLHHGSPFDLSPSVSVVTSGTGRTFQIMALGSSSTSPSYANTVSFRYADQPIPFGRWVDLVFKVRLNTSGNGFLQVWMDGTQIVDHRGLLGYITPGYKPYFKFGYYNWSGSNFASTRKVLVRSPVVVSDPTGTKYQPEDLRAYVNAH